MTHGKDYVAKLDKADYQEHGYEDDLEMGEVAYLELKGAIYETYEALNGGNQNAIENAAEHLTKAHWALEERENDE